MLVYLNSSTVKAEILTGEKFTVSVGDRQSWTGRNGTGNLSYYRCDRAARGGEANRDNCIYLTGGKVTCSDETRTIRQNQNYSYVLSSPITQATVSIQTTSTLTIYSDSQVILEEGLRPKPFDNLESQN